MPPAPACLLCSDTPRPAPAPAPWHTLVTSNIFSHPGCLRDAPSRVLGERPFTWAAFLTTSSHPLAWMPGLGLPGEGRDLAGLWLWLPTGPRTQLLRNARVDNHLVLPVRKLASPTPATGQRVTAGQTGSGRTQHPETQDMRPVLDLGADLWGRQASHSLQQGGRTLPGEATSSELWVKTET